MILLAAFLAGLFLFLREALPYAAAASSGEIRTRGYNRERVARSADPERFAAFMRRRRRNMLLPLGIMACAAAWTGIQVLGAVAS